MIKRCLTSLVATLIVCFLACSSASARVCFLPDSTDCGSSDVNIPDVPCKYYSCKEAGGESNAYQTCYPERTYNNGGVNVTCWQVKCNISKSDCEAQAKATSQSCKFDDASGCYYLGECKQCNKDLYDLKEPKSGSDWECDSCTGCDGTFYNCTAKEKECKDINSKYTSSCGDSQIAEEVKGVKDSKGNQCYTCKSKPIDKCVDIEATPFLDIIEPTVTTVKASGEVKEVNATLECGINPKKAYKYEINISNNYDYINLPVKRIKPVEYRYYASGSLPGYYYKTIIDGKNVCITDRLCTQYAKDGEYISAYEISINTGARLDHKIYCCKTDDNFSGDSLRNLYSSCKEAQPIFESQHIDRYIKPFYVCDKGVKEGTKCKIGSYSCPKDYKLSGDNCVKKECPKGYVLTSDNGKDVCVNPTYTCPTDGKYKYKLSGDKCVCDNSKTCSKISNGTWKGEKDKNTCPTGYKPKVVESTIGATAFSDGPCYKCEGKVTITIILDATNTTVNFSSISSDNKGYTVKLSLNGGGNDGITYPVTVTEGRTATYFSSTYEPGDCDVYGDNCDNDLGNGRETVSAASNLSVIINDQTVLNNLTTENEYLDMRYFIGKTYDTDNYIIKFVKAQTCSDIGYQTTPCSTGYKQIDYIQLPHEDCYTCSKCYKESSSGTVANKSTIYYYRADEPYKNGECASEMTLNVVCDNTNQKAKLYVNGKETQANPNSYQNTEGKWFGDFMNCTGCATVECTFKYGDKTKITIPQTGGPGD